MKRFLLITISLVLCLTLAAPNVWAGRGGRSGKHYSGGKHHGGGYHGGGRHYGGKYRGGHHYRSYGRHYYGWDRFAVGLGAAIVGGAILHSVVQPAPVVRYETTYAPAPSGRWENRRVWVQPSYKQTWEPGHYNQNRVWVTGRWIKIVDRPGYWTEQRVWVGYR